jgi:hypothetical protein
MVKRVESPGGKGSVMYDPIVHEVENLVVVLGASLWVGGKEFAIPAYTVPRGTMFRVWFSPKDGSLEREELARAPGSFLIAWSDAADVFVLRYYDNEPAPPATVWARVKAWWAS